MAALPAGLQGAAASAPSLPEAPRLSKERIKSTAIEFEAVYLSGMLEEMFAGIEESPFDRGPGSAIWRSFRTEEFARAIAQNGGIGLADHVQRQLIALQESQS